MRKSPLALIAAGIAGVAVLQAVRLIDPQWTALAATPALMQGCTDVPEAVALAEDLRLRGIGIDRALDDLDRRKAEIAAAEERLKARLVQLRAAKQAAKDGERVRQTDADTGIARLIAVYDAMKPADAAQVLGALPPDFAAEILARVQPENGARIIAALDPGQAAIMTAHMGQPQSTKD